MNTILTIIASSVATIWVVGIIIQVLIFTLLPKVCKLIAMAIAGDVMDEKEIDDDIKKMEEDLPWTWYNICEVVFWPIMLPISIAECRRCFKKTENNKEDK